MSVNAGTLFYEVDAKTERLLVAEKQIDDSINRMESRVKKLDKSVSGWSKTSGKARNSTAALDKSLNDTSSSATKATTSINQADKSVKGTGTSAERTGRSVKQMGEDAGRAGTQMRQSTEGAELRYNNLTAGIKRAAAAYLTLAAARQAFNSIITATGDFESSMLTVQAVTRATEAQMASLEQQARELGATTIFSAKQAADAQGELARMGFEVNEVLAVTPGLLNFAVAAELDLAEAAKIASGTMRGMRLEIGQMPRVMDVLTATAGNSGTTVAQLGESMRNVAPIASGLGVSLEETAAAVGMLANSNIQGGRSGTALMAALRQLANVTPQSRKQLEAYGLSVDDLSVRTHGLAEVMDRLANSGIMSNDQAMFQIFGSEGQAAAQILMNGAQELDNFTGNLREATGEVDRMAAILGQGLTNRIRSFNSALSESTLRLGKGGVGGAFESLLLTATGVLSVYNGMYEAFADNNEVSQAQEIIIRGLADGMKLLAIIMAGVLTNAVVTSTAAKTAYTAIATRATAAVTALTGASTRLAAAQVALAGATRAASAAFAMIGGPVGAAVIAALGVYHFREELGLVDPAADAAEKALKELAKAIKDGDEAALNSSYEALTLELQSIQLEAQAAMQSLMMLERQERMQAGAHEGIASETRSRIAQMNQEMADMWARMAEIESARKRIESRRKELSSGSTSSSEETDPPPVTPPGTTAAGGGEARRRENEFAAVQRQLATEREAIEREYKERNRIILENTAQGSQQQLGLLQRSADERQSQLDRMTERVMSGLRTESERIRNEYERRNESILSITEEGSAERADMLARSQENYLQRVREYQEREAQQEKAHQERLIQQQKEADLQRIMQLTGFHEDAARKVQQIHEATANPMKTLAEGLETAFVNLDDTISSAFMRGMMDGQSFNNILNNIGQTVVGSLLQSFVRLGVQMMISALTQQKAGAAMAGTAMAQAAAVQAAWAPAALSASIATLGGATATGAASYAAALAANTATGTAITGGFMSQIGPGRQRGGPVYPGMGYPVTEDGRPEILTEGSRQYLLPGKGGKVTPNSEISGGSFAVDVQIINNGPPMEASANMRSAGDKRFILEVTTEAIVAGGNMLDKGIQSSYRDMKRNGR